MSYRIPISIRNACMDDAELLWRWANESTVRKASFTTDAIAWESHLAWLERKLGNASCLFYIATVQNGIPIGQIRFDIEGDRAVVSLSLSREFRNKGYGAILLGVASEKVFSTIPVQTIHAYVKSSNHASIGAFTKAHYTDKGIQKIIGVDAHHFILWRSEFV